MAIDKSNTPMWMKVVLIGLALVFVFGFVTMMSNPFAAFQSTPSASQTTDSAETLQAQYQPTVDALNGSLASDPESYTALVALGNTYFDWAIKLSQSAQASQKAQSQISTDTMLALQSLWTSASATYGAAVKIDPKESGVMTDYAIATHYSGDSAEAVTIAVKVTKKDPNFAPAWFNLGIFYGTLGQNAEAVAAFERYLKLDPQGQQGDTEFAKQQIDALKSATTGTTGTTGGTTGLGQ